MIRDSKWPAKDSASNRIYLLVYFYSVYLPHYIFITLELQWYRKQARRNEIVSVIRFI